MATNPLVPPACPVDFPAENGPNSGWEPPDADRRLPGSMTVLRFPGVSQPTPQAPAGPVLASPSYATVASSIGVAVTSLEALKKGLGAAATSFRGGDVTNANGRLVQIASGLRLLSTLADVAATASGLELGSLESFGRLEDMGQALDELTARQFNADWTGVADALDGAVLPALAGWREIFTEILVEADGRYRQPRAS